MISRIDSPMVIDMDAVALAFAAIVSEANAVSSDDTDGDNVAETASRTLIPPSTADIAASAVAEMASDAAVSGSMVDTVEDTGTDTESAERPLSSV